MPNILSAKVLNQFAKQVPELRDALRAARMELDPSMTVFLSSLWREALRYDADYIG